MFRNHTDTIRCKANEKPTCSYQETSFNCDLCNTVWMTETDVDIHRKQSHLGQLLSMIKSNKHHICLTCVRDQGSPLALLEHIKSEHLLSSPNAHRVEREIYICDKCNHIFFNKIMLTAHIKFIHGSRTAQKTYTQCPKCFKNIHISKVWFHFSLHQLNLISTCQICFLDCKNLKKLREHLKSHPGHFLCDMCNFITHKDRYFHNHIVKHKRRSKIVPQLEARRFFIPGTFYGPWKYVLETGIKGLQIHDVYICVLCREICSSKSEMRDHITVDHGPETDVKRKPICSCGEEFFNTVLLKHHVFKMQGDHKIVDDTDFGKLLAEHRNTLATNEETMEEENDDFCGYEIIIDTEDEIINIDVPLPSYSKAVRESKIE